MQKTFNVNQFSDAIGELFQQVASALPDITQIIAKDAIALTKNRIQESGISAEGSSFPAYSKEYSKVKTKKNGEQSVKFRNLTLTGDMFRQLNIVSTNNEQGKYTVTVGGKSDFAQDKIDWNSEQIGDILEVSAEEEKIFAETMDDEIQKIIDKAGFGQ